MQKRGQITVFIILGLLILFGAIFMIQLVKKTKTSQLELQQEAVIGKAFKKEGIRLFVEDCLKDGLENGLIVIGRQGRVWQEQGGTIKFQERVTGRTVSGINVSYGLTAGSLELKYPCLNGKEPDFCQYQYPNGSIMPSYPVKFGERKIDLNQIELDLELYLINRTITCVENFTLHNLSSKARISTSNPKISLNFQDEGIQVDVNYPLKLGVEGQEFTHLAEFDFFYSTKIKPFLEAVVTQPLGFDQSLLDFNYTPETLSAGSFNYNIMEKGILTTKSIMLNPAENLISFEKNDLGDGDELFKFTASSILSANQKYLFQFVRQNRAPALDYVERYSCNTAGYDYLVIKEDSDLDEVNLTVFALDPDEDSVLYSYDSLNTFFVDNDVKEDSFLYVPQVTGFYNITANVSDEHSNKDSQLVRVLVDRSMKSQLQLVLPYNVTYQSGDRYVVSKEDPVFLTVTLPEKSLVDEKPTITLKYTGITETLLATIPKLSGDNCFGLPWLLGCSIDKYNYQIKGKELINSWNTFLLSPDLMGADSDGFGHFSENTGDSYGLLELNYSVNYCGKTSQSGISRVRVMVKDCIAHRNSSYPYAYPYHNIKVDETGKKTTEKGINPFLSNHVCCLGVPEQPSSWKLADKSKVCYEGEEEMGCFGGGSLLSTRKLTAYCDGVRGNICDGETQYSSYTSTGKCGTRALGCSNVVLACESKEPFSLVGGSWCYGTEGCEKSCSSEIVDTVGGLGFSADTLKKNSAQYKCGCEEKDAKKSQKCYSLKEKKEGVCETTGIYFKTSFCKI